MICPIVLLNNRVKYFYFQEEKEIMKRARLKPLRCLAKREWRNLVAQNLELHSLSQRPCSESSESDDSLSEYELREKAPSNFF